MVDQRAFDSILLKLSEISSRLKEHTDAISSNPSDYEKRVEEQKKTQRSVKLTKEKAVPTLTGEESARYTNIAKAFNKVFKIDEISKSINKLREYNEERDEQLKRQSLLSTVKRTAPEISQNKKEKSSDTGIIGTLSKWAKGIGMLLTPLLGASSKIFAGVGKVVLKGISSIGKSVTGIFEKIVSHLGGLGSKMLGMFKTKFPKITKIFEGVFEVFAKPFKGIANLFKGEGASVLTKIGESKVGAGFFKNIAPKLFKFAGKSLKFLKVIPFIGSLVSFYYAKQYFDKGEPTNGLLEIAAGIANLFPFAGTAIAMGIEAIVLLRDFSGASKREGERTKANGASWLTNAFKKLKNKIIENCYNWPILGPMIRAAQHFADGEYKEGLISMGHIIPGVSVLLSMIDVKETGTIPNRPFNSTFDIKGLSNTMFDMASTLTSNIIKSLGPGFEDILNGKYEEGITKMLPKGMQTLLDGKIATGTAKYEPKDTSPSDGSIKTPISRINSFTNAPIAKPNDWKKDNADVDAIKDLQSSLNDMDRQQLTSLNEQTLILRDTRSIMNGILEGIKTMQVAGGRAPTAPPEFRYSEQTSSTRRDFIDSMNMLGTSIRGEGK